jgi:hypothetical protein
MFCACAGRFANETTPLSRYDLTPQAGKKLSIPSSPPSRQAVYFNMVYLPPRGVYGFYKHCRVADKHWC